MTTLRQWKDKEEEMKGAVFIQRYHKTIESLSEFMSGVIKSVGLGFSDTVAFFSSWDKVALNQDGYKFPVTERALEVGAPGTVNSDMMCVIALLGV
ncbi:hypothetical protein Tco_0865525 [Tanacetum coccineum]